MDVIVDVRNANPAMARWSRETATRRNDLFMTMVNKFLRDRDCEYAMDLHLSQYLFPVFLDFCRGKYDIASRAITAASREDLSTETKIAYCLTAVIELAGLPDDLDDNDGESD